MSAFLFLAGKREIAEARRALSIAALASSGDGATIKKQLDDWEREI